MTPLAAGRGVAGRAPVPPPGWPKRIQRAAQGRRAADGGRAAAAGRAHPGLGGTIAADGCHPGRLRPVEDHDPAVEPVRLGWLWLRDLAQPVLLACQADAIPPPTAPSPGSAWPTPS